MQTPDLFCPYCGAPAELRSASLLFPQSTKRVYLCSNWPDCDAHAFLGPDGNPVGELITRSLRRKRLSLKTRIDNIVAQGTERIALYRFLSDSLGASFSLTALDEDECEQLSDLLRSFE